MVRRFRGAGVVAACVMATDPAGSTSVEVQATDHRSRAAGGHDIVTSG